MGYYIHTSGDLKIEPPLTMKELREHPEWLGFNDTDGKGNVIRWAGRTVMVVTEDEHENTDDGVLIRRQGVSVKIWSDELRDFEDDLQRLVDTFPGHRWVGRIDVEGDENLDVWRVFVRGGKVIRTKPEIVWPPDPPEDEFVGEL